MARRRRETDDLERDDDPIASLLLQVPTPGPVLTPETWRTPVYDVLTEIEDRRTFSPEGPYRDPFATTSLPGQIRQAPTKPGRLATRAAFDAPRDVAICVRRKSRREVIFAKRKAGAGARARRRRNYWSNVKC